MVRRLGPSDEAALQAFFVRFPYTTLFFQRAFVRFGLGDEALRWTGAFEGPELVGLMFYDTQGRLVMEAPTRLPELVAHAVKPAEPVWNLLGPRDQIVAAQAELGRADEPTQLDTRERLYALDLKDLRVPAALASGTVVGRRATEHDWEVLFAFRTAYEIEIVNVTETPEAVAARHTRLRSALDERVAFVLEDDRGSVVAMSAFNARVPDCVQIGSVFTPPERRSQGYARAVVAASLQIAHDEGVTRSVLFTEVNNVAAQRAYEALGYRPVGEYGIVLFHR